MDYLDSDKNRIPFVCKLYARATEYPIKEKLNENSVQKQKKKQKQIEIIASGANVGGIGGGGGVRARASCVSVLCAN